jgi:tight adherence protein B
MEDIILKDFAVGSGSEDILNFFNAYLTAKESGGDIEKLINSSCKTLIDKIEIDNEIQTITAKKKFEGRILTVVPIIIIILMRASGSGYMDVLYESLAGRIVMTLALCILCLSFYLSSKIADIKL